MTTQQKKGFTIIEVVLVLAIAGLIFLMVFIALPALQRGQRDTQRRDDVSTFISQLTQYGTNNRGGVPAETALASFKTNYLKWAADDSGDFNDPKTGIGYIINYGDTVPTVDGTMMYRNNRLCSGEQMTTTGATARSAAVMVKLEGSGVFCQDNQ